MGVAVYVRPGRQRKNDGQKAEIQGWLDGNSIDPVRVRWYSDKGTGTRGRQPEFERLQRDIADGKIRTVVLWKLDRLSSRLKDGVVTLADWCDRGLRIVVVRQQLEFDGTVGRTVAALLLGLSQIESEYRRERQAAGIARAKREGRYQGRARGTLKASPDRAKALRDRGLTAPEIAEELSVSLRTVFRYIGAPAADTCPKR